MNEDEARQLMLAADYNPVLAAWAAVSVEHGVVCVSDTSPYEAWAAFQELYNHDFVTTDDYNQGERLFFKKTPRTVDIQSVLSQIQPICHTGFSEEIQMPHNDDLDPFASTNSITKRNAPRGDSQIQSRSRQALDNPFASTPAAIESRPRHGELAPDMFAPEPGGLPCHNIEQMPNQSASALIDGESYTSDIRCSGTDKNPHPSEQVQMAPFEGYGVDGSSNSYSQLVLALFAGVCRQCGLLHHSSVGKMEDPGAFR
jgi:hypothetical protein